MTSVQERLKLKRTTLDVWSTREKLSLASSVLRSGDQNWSCVSRNIRSFAEPNRPPDWFSQKNCAQQYGSLLENVETPKRKKRAAGSTDKTEVETPGECIVRKLTAERIEELKKIMILTQTAYLREKEAINAIINGEADDKLSEMLQEIEDEKKQKELEKEAHAKWLKERDERKIELERAWKPGSQLANLRRASSMSEASSEADSPLSEPLNVDVAEESVMTKPTPTSPLLTSLLKSPSTAAQSSQSSSILHSAITSPLRGSSPTIASLLSSSPGLPGSLVMPPSNVSSNLKNLVSNAIAGSFSEEHKVVPQSPSQGAPTLSMLLELPPSVPGKPLPMLQAQPVAPPPYSEHLGPPPPYSQATEYLQQQKQRERAEQLAQSQAAQVLCPPPPQTPPPPLAQPAQVVSSPLWRKLPEEEPKETPIVPAASVETTPVSSTPHTVSARRGSLKGRRLELQTDSDVEDSKLTIADTSGSLKVTPVKDKDQKRIHTADHDYSESPMKEKEKTPVKKVETDVFEFDELKEGYDKFDLMIKDSKMSYLKSNATRFALKKDAEAGSSAVKNPEAKSYLRDNEKRASPPREPKIIITTENDEDIPLKDLVKKEVDIAEDVAQEKLSPKVDVSSRSSRSPSRETDSKRSSRLSSDGAEVEETTTSTSPRIHLRVPSTEELIVKDKPASVTKRKSSDVDPNLHLRKSPSAESLQLEEKEDINLAILGDEASMPCEAAATSAVKMEEQFEEEKVEETEDSESAKDDEALCHLADTLKSEKVDLSTTEDEKSNDTAPRVYSRRRGTTSFSDSVPNSPAPLTEEDKEYRVWKKTALLVFNRLSTHRLSSVFMKPITDEQAPGYRSIVRRPMDLCTIKRNIELGSIRTTAEFRHAVCMMLLNAMMYNKDGTLVYNMAKEMYKDSLEHFKMLMQATGEIAPTRRETRLQGSEVKARVSEKHSQVTKNESKRNRTTSKSGSAEKTKVKTEVKVTSEKTPSLPLKRKRATVGSAESVKKRIKVEDN